MKPKTHYRHRSHIVDVSEDKENPSHRQFLSVNKAKKESLKIQMKTDGALGRGSVALA